MTITVPKILKHIEEAVASGIDISDASDHKNLRIGWMIGNDIISIGTNQIKAYYQKFIPLDSRYKPNDNGWAGATFSLYELKEVMSKESSNILYLFMKDIHAAKKRGEDSRK
jgi:hypothetical protein